MGQKVSPHGLRVGIIKDWSSTWYANKKDFSNNLIEDYKIRTYLKETLKASGIYKLDISRKANSVKVDVYTAKPGMIIGKGGAAIEELRTKLNKMIGKDVSLNIVEVKDVDFGKYKNKDGYIRDGGTTELNDNQVEEVKEVVKSEMDKISKDDGSR